MTSSMLTGDRKWTPSRKGGMTVLGKVVVPRPINLPSQRLENHGQNRDVEIVPKGTLSWGSKQTSSSLNAWGVPNNDGGTSSPGQLSGRPSSGGSGTRPSTAGSDFTHEHSTNAWAPNSRPSSASASLALNQGSLVSLRPHSAETRQGSSQLSRFAEPASDNPGAWVAAGTADQLGGFSSNSERFSLSSGDFPTLGVEKETSGRNIEHQERGPHGRPSSSSGVASRKEDVQNTQGDFSCRENRNSGHSNSWRREGPHYTNDGARPGTDKWHPGSHPYPNSSIPPQHYDAWRGLPLNTHPGGVWYRGPPGGPPFGLPVAPGGFPMEPFPYYRPHVPSPAMENQQPVPSAGTGPRGSHPRNGDMYRPPHLHDAYFRPGMPIRPGFYPGPVSYDGYYGPPMGYVNSNERDLQSMAVAAEPSAYNRFTGPHTPDIGNSHSRLGGYGPSGKPMVLEQMEPGHNQDTRGQVLPKQYDQEDKDEQHGWEDNMTTYPSRLDKGGRLRDFSREGGWRADHIKDLEMGGRKVAVIGGDSLGVTDQRELPVRPKSVESLGNSRESDYNLLGRLDIEDHKSSALSEVSAVPEDPSLIQKIEGLNAKVRATDGGRNATFLSRGEEQKNKVQLSDAKVDPSLNGGGSGPVALERIRKEHISEGDRIVESKGSSSGISRKPAQGMHGRTDNRGNRGQGRITTLETDGSHEGSLATGSAGVVAAVRPEHLVVVPGRDGTSAEAIEKSATHPVVNDEGEHMPSMTDSGDSHSQRAKMIELAKQRLKQREKEEEERARDQKVKALAKLEELNRRSQAVEGSTQKLENVSSSAIQNKQEECLTYAPPTVVALNAKGQGSVLGPKPKALMSGSESNLNRVEKSSSWSSEGLLEVPKAARKDPMLHGLSETMNKHVNVSDASASKQNHQNNGSQVHDAGPSTSKQKVGNTKNPSIPLETKSTTQTAVPDNATVYFGGVPVEISSHCGPTAPVNSSVMTEPSVQHRKNRSGMSKQKLEETSSKAAVASNILEDKSTSKGTTSLESVADGGKSKNNAESIVDLTSVQPPTDLTERTMELPASLPNEDTHPKANNQWKSHHFRRMPRNPPVDRPVEKLHSGDSVVWAPVRTHNKTESSDEVAHKAVVAASSSIKREQPAQHNPRNKRAEMERYIPKPAAKEVSQQGSNHQAASPPIIQVTPHENMQKCESVSLCTESSQTSSTTTVKVVSVGESKNGDGKQSKHGKAYGSWRRRGSAETTSSFPSDQSKNDQIMSEHSQPQKLAIPEKGQSQPVDDWNFSDGQTTPENFVAPVTLSVPKDQGVAARGKRRPFKGQRGTGYNRDSDDKKISSEEAAKNNTRTSSPEVHEGESSAHSKEKHTVGDQSISHWQPKSQPSAANQWGITSTGSQKVVDEVGQDNIKDTYPKELGAQLSPQSEKENVLGEPSLSNEVLAGHREMKQDRKIGFHKSGPGRPGESSCISDMDDQNDQQMAPGFHKHMNQNSRSVRDHEPHGDRSEAGKDYKPYNGPVNRHRHRYNSHYEYQPIGSHDTSKTNMEPLKDGSHNYHSRFRERGQSHTRHGSGHYNGRQTGTSQVDASD